MSEEKKLTSEASSVERACPDQGSMPAGCTVSDREQIALPAGSHYWKFDPAADAPRDVEVALTTPTVVRFEIEYADGTIHRLRGPAAEDHVNRLNGACVMQAVRSGFPSVPEQPWEVARPSRSSQEGT